MSNVLQVKRLFPTARLPTCSTEHAAGYDLYAYTGGSIAPGGTHVVPTGIAIALPFLPEPLRVYGRIHPRSGLAVRHSIDVGAGVIDTDYRGEVKVVLFNHGTEEFVFAEGDRIAQLILEVHVVPPIKETSELSLVGSRGENGFGSSGK